MPVEVILPKVDMDMTHGTLAVWHVAEGETVAKGAALFDIETDKAAMEVEAPAAGRLHGVSARPGDKVAVGTVVALIYAEGEAVAEAAAGIPVVGAQGAEVERAAEVAPPAAAPVAASVPEPAAFAGLRATPAARAGARAQGVELGAVRGTGPLGRIQARDVAEHARAEAPAAPVAAAPAVWSAQSGPLHVSHRKGGGVPLVMIHGFTADSQNWAPLEKAMGVQRALIRIDLPGHGRSPRRRVRGFADLSRMIVEAFDDATAKHEAVHVLGHSLGGALALACADLRARRVASLTLISPAGLGPEIDAAALTGITRATRTESLAPWLRRLTATPEGISDDYARAAMKLRTDPDLRAAQAEMAEVLFPDGVQGFDLRAALSRLDVPTAVIWGRQDHILPMRHALLAEAELGIHLLTRAGHIPQIECPDRVASILARHMVSVEAVT